MCYIEWKKIKFVFFDSKKEFLPKVFRFSLKNDYLQKNSEVYLHFASYNLFYLNFSQICKSILLP